MTSQKLPSLFSVVVICNVLYSHSGLFVIYFLLSFVSFDQMKFLHIFYCTLIFSVQIVCNRSHLCEMALLEPFPFDISH